MVMWLRNGQTQEEIRGGNAPQLPKLPILGLSSIAHDRGCP